MNDLAPGGWAGTGPAKFRGEVKVSGNGTFGGDVTLDDGGTFVTTLQTVTPTANRVISLPDATGTVGLVAGSSGQIVYNNAGAYAGISSLTFDGTNVTQTSRLIHSYSSTPSNPAKLLSGTWAASGTSTTTKPHLLIEPSSATSTGWSTSGTGLGVNAASGFTGNLLDAQLNGTTAASIRYDGRIQVGTASAGLQSIVTAAGFHVNTSTNILFSGENTLASSNLGGAFAGLYSNDGAAMASGDRLGGFFFGGSSSSTSLRNAAIVQGFADENWSDGSAYGSRIEIGVTPNGSTTRATYFTFRSTGVTLADGVNIVAGTSTGTKIGTATTQKIGFFDKTPIIQPASANQAALTNSSGGTANGTIEAVGATNTGDVSSAINNNFTELHVLLNEIRTALVNLGLIKGAA